MWRSILFVPVLEARFITKTRTRGADALLFDLEASIAPLRNGKARTAMRQVGERLRGQDTDLLVRINICSRCWRMSKRRRWIAWPHWC